MALLGRRVGELHGALCRTTGDPAFDPEPATQGDLVAWKAAVERELDASLAAAESVQAGLPDATRVLIAPLLAGRERMRARVANIAADVHGLVRTRCHGDLHLGQVLVAQDDFVIVDFEGEPARTVGERREKTCVLRDVAGMVGSFHYAAHAAILRRDPGTPLAQSAADAVAEWERGAKKAFIKGYREATAGVASVPRDDAAFHALLDLFLIDKALYELRYEMSHRPDWIAIPLQGLLELSRP
jgi:maltose alpha-D-glucosyltransferase/alpha-amylase